VGLAGALAAVLALGAVVANIPGFVVPTPGPSARVAATAIPASSPVASGPAIKVPSSIDATGASDVTAALQSFLEGVPNGSTVAFRAGARYLVEGRILLEGRRELQIDGQGATFFSDGRAGQPLWRIEGGSGVGFSAMTIIGTNDRAGTSDAYLPEIQHAHAFDLRGARNVSISKVTMERLNGDCLYVGPNTAGDWSERVTMTDSVCRSNGRMGVAITGGRDVAIEGNRFDEIAIYTFDIEPNEREPAEGGERILFADNDVGTGSHSDAYTPYFAAANGWGIATDVTIRDNRLTGQAMWMVASPGQSPFRRSRFTISGNLSDTPAEGREVLDFVGHEDLLVTGNRQPIVGDVPFATVKRSCRFSVVGNDIPGGTTEVEVTDEGCPT
jgi:hypothetical protein